jgi:branched-chain amino acid transport system ATP-binding protein
MTSSQLPPKGSTVLQLSDIELRFGGIAVLSDLDLSVQQGAVHALIGPNGAGKTSVLNCISGFYHPSKGTIDYAGTSLLGRRPDNIAALKIARVFQNIELFPHLSVLENILIGRHRQVRYTPLEAVLPFGRSRREEIRHRGAAEDLIDLLEIKHIRDTSVAALPYGLEKKVELGRALAADPDLLLLDEPFGGLNLEEKRDMARYVLEVSRLGKTILLIDHDVQVVADISDRITVLNYGRKIAEGTAHEVLNQPDVIEAYLGRQKVSADDQPAVAR